MIMILLMLITLINRNMDASLTLEILDNSNNPWSAAMAQSFLYFNNPNHIQLKLLVIRAN